MLTLILAVFGGWNLVGEPQKVNWDLAPAKADRCYSLTCQCRDCQGAECRCGSLAKIPAAIPVFNRPETPDSSIQTVGFRAVRTCGPNGCSVQMVPTADSNLQSSQNYTSGSCQGGQCGVSESRGFRPLKMFRGGKGGGRRSRGCASCGG